jgi:hypothetical protein
MKGKVLSILAVFLLNLGLVSAISNSATINDDSIISLGLLLSIFVVSIYFLILSTKLENPTLKMFFVMISLIFIIGGFLTGYLVIEELSTLEGIGNIFLGFFFVLSGIFVVMLSLVLINLTKDAFDSMNRTRGFKI